MTDANNPVDTGTGEPSTALSLDAAADRLAGLLGSDPEQEAPAEDTNALPETEAEDDTEAPDLDDWDTPEPDDEGQSDESETEDENADQPREDGRFVGDTAKVRLPDGRVVTVGELRSGSMMQSDYTRKTQELAEQRKSVESRQTELQQLEATITQQRELAIAILEANLPKPPSREMLRDDPLGYIEAKEAYEEQMAKLGALQQERTRHTAMQEQAQQKAYSERVQQEVTKLLDKAPELRSPEKLTRFHKELTETFERSYGISGDELLQVGDHRYVLMMRDALRYQRIQANKAKSTEKVSGKPPVVKPSGRQSPQANAQRDVNAMKAQLRKSGSIDDAAALILHSFKR